MAGELGPSIAAKVARAIYAVQPLPSDGDVAKALDIAFPPDVQAQFSTAGAKLLRGRSGLGVTTASGFGAFSEGKGARAGETLLALRGTATGYDVLTDIYATVVPGADSSGVHAGFKACFGSLADGIEAYFAARKPRVVHIVGHSLGGALATLAASRLARRGAAVKLYTFGSPRVGLASFATDADRRIGADNIYRCYHSADPVAMMPIFPFRHVSVEAGGYRLDWPGDLVAVRAHLMDGYVASVDGKSWAGIGRVRSPFASLAEAEAWLERAASAGAHLPALSASVLEMAAQALNLIVQATGVVTLGATMACETVIDWVAALVATGVRAAAQTGETIRHFVNLCLKIVGQAADFASESAGLAMAALRRLLALLVRSIGAAAQQAAQLVIP